ncbi:MAG: HAD-IA family hydrolase [Candidatus Bathyarchaeota archaeon]
MLFDLEGTLVESAYQRYPDIIQKLREETRKRLVDLGVPRHILAELVRSSTMRNRAYRWAEENGSPGEVYNLKEGMEEFMAEYDMAAARKARLYPETLGVLKALWERKVMMAIVTNTSSDAAYNMLGKLGLGRYFTTVVTRSDTLKMKPDPEMVRLAELRMGAQAGWLVGDSHFDAVAAQRSGIFSIIVRRDGVRPDFKHDCFIDSLDSLPSMLGI